MNQKKLAIWTIVGVIAAILAIWLGIEIYGKWFMTSNVSPMVSQALDTLIKVQSPREMSVVSSPLTITGQAVGGWYFEASFPIELLDANSQIVGQAVAQAQSDWMTTAMVPFTASLVFPAQPAGSQGTLVLKKDNPSGEPQNDDSYSVNVVF